MRRRVTGAVLGSEPTGTVVRFHEVPTARVLKVGSLDGVDVFGCYVKFAPRLRRSERSTLDAATIVEDLKAFGAVAAVVAPVVIPDEVTAPVEAPSADQSVDARAEVSAWFGEEPDDERAEALRTCLRILDQVGF